MTHTAPCERCSVAIGVEAHRCPECGYDPSGLLRVTVLAALAVPALAVSIAAVIAAVAPGFVPWMPTVAAGTAEAFALPGVIVSATILLAYARQDRRRPTDSTVF